MRAAILLVPLVALAAYAGASQTDPYGDNAAASMNAVEQAATDAEAAVDMDMAGNVTMPQQPRPAWMADGFWLIAAEEPSGATWYFEPFQSDFTVTPFRVMLRTDESRVAGRRHNNVARTIELDCVGRRYRILSTTTYDDAGNATETLQSGDGTMILPAAGSAWAALVEEVCRHDARQRGERGPDGEVTSNGM